MLLLLNLAPSTFSLFYDPTKEEKNKCISDSFACPYEEMKCLCILKTIENVRVTCWLWETLAQRHVLHYQDRINTDGFCAFIQVWTWHHTIFIYFFLFLSCCGQAILPVNFPAVSHHVIYLLSLQALMSVFLPAQFIPHLFSAIAACNHPVITSAHKV